MSSIDSYKHELLGFIICESDYDIIHGNQTRKIAVYRLDQNIPSDESDFDGKINDILVGGGRGEAPAFRISYPNAFNYFVEEEFGDFDEYTDLFKSFWSLNQTFELCNGFLKSGWEPKENIEFWLAEQVCNLLIKHVPEYAENRKLSIETKIEFIKP